MTLDNDLELLLATFSVRISSGIPIFSIKTFIIGTKAILKTPFFVFIDSLLVPRHPLIIDPPPIFHLVIVLLFSEK